MGILSDRLTQRLQATATIAAFGEIEATILVAAPEPQRYASVERTIRA